MFATIVAFEGGDSCGKHTQSVKLQKRLTSYGMKCALVEIPFNDSLTYRVIYKMLRSGSAKRHPNAFQFLQFLNKFLFQWTYYLWLWIWNDYIILDRWSLSSIIYGGVTGSNKTMNLLLYYMLDEPHLTFILDGPSHSRERERDSYEKDSELQTNVKQAYRDWAAARPSSMIVINNQGTEDEVHMRIMSSMMDRL